MDLVHDCDSSKCYSKQYDAYYCESCNAWLEDACDDPTCEFCTARPKTPLETQVDN